MWSALVLGSSADHREKFIVCHLEKISWSEPIGRVQDVRFPPTHELLPEIRRHRSLAQRGPRITQRQWRPQKRPAPHVETPYALHLIDCVDSRVDRSCERQ